MRGTFSFCVQCREEIGIVEVDGKFFSRPIRFSHCKGYKSTGSGGWGYTDTCRSRLLESAHEALADFPQKHSGVDPATAQASADDTSAEAKTE